MRVLQGVNRRWLRVAGAALLIVALGAGADVMAQAASAGAQPEPSNQPTRGQGEQEQGQAQAEQEQEQAQGEQGQGEGQQQATPPPVGQQVLSPEEREALALVEQIIREQEGMLMGSDFSYDSGGRRDPFLSLVPTGSVQAPTVRPFGLPGFLISEIDLKAIAGAQGRWHAMVTGPDQRAYFIEVGTVLFDGHVVEIRPGEVVFEQEVPDPMGARRIREVTKRLRTTDGGGQTP